jgi:RNA polymerase sigma factor (sigma-70 family)
VARQVAPTRDGESPASNEVGDEARERRDFAEIYDRYAPMLYRYAVRRLGADFAEDVVAETFLAAFRHQGRYDPNRGDRRAWLFGILTHEIARRHRGEAARYRALAQVAATRPEQDLAERVAETASAAAAGPALHRALARLKRSDRDVLLLVAWADLSPTEVAEVLAIPVGTVRSRLFRARKIVRRELSGARSPS